MKIHKLYNTKIIGLVSLALLSFFIVLTFTGASHSRERKPWFFVQISDPQLGFYPDKIEKEIQNFEAAVERINKVKPDFVVITGDLVHNERDKFQLSEYKRIVSLIDVKIPVYQIPGNHDVTNEPKNDDIEFYKNEYRMDDKFSFVHKGHRFIGINSNLIKSHTPTLESEQWKWLNNELKKSKKADGVVIFSHHPFFTHDINEPVAYFNVDTLARKQYFDLFKSHNVQAVFAGHHHQNGYATYDGIEMVTTSAIGEPLGKDPVGLRLIRVEKKQLKHQYFALDSIPDTF